MRQFLGRLLKVAHVSPLSWIQPLGTSSHGVHGKRGGAGGGALGGAEGGRGEGGGGAAGGGSWQSIHAAPEIVHEDVASGQRAGKRT